MGLIIFYQEDITRILAAALEQQRNTARSVTAIDGEYAAAYQRGFVDAVMALSVAFGVRVPCATRVVVAKPEMIDNGWR